MSDAVQIELIRGLTTGVPLIITSVASIIGSYFAFTAAKHAKETLIQAKQTEVNTNHLKDELVEAVRDSAFQRGGEVKDAAFQAGVKFEKEGKLDSGQQSQD